MSANQPLPVGTLTFLFTDIEGSTNLVKDLGTAAFSRVLDDHGRIVGGALDAAGGHRVRSEGDSFFYVFARPTEAVAAAVNAQVALAAHAFPNDLTVRVRMGMHTGEGTAGSAASGTDYVGYDVHRAARIASAGHGGQVLLSETTRELVRDALPAGVTLLDLGLHRFKDLARAERVHQLVIGGLPSQFPRIKTLDAVPNNLPVQLTSFVGREREIAEGVRLFSGARLLTLTGPGGTGKTRLSLHIAANVADQFPGGVTFVPLASITDPDHVAPAIVQALGLEQGGSRPHKDRLLDHLGTRRALLVLDNFEQVLGASSLVAELLRACPDLRVITSSRAPLRVSGEQEFPVPPLDLPRPSQPGSGELSAESVSQYEAVRLFVERAVAMRPNFQVTNENAPAVAEICARLDGLPLAIELAAARIKLLTPAAILARLANRLNLLQSGARDLPARQQTLRGAIDWSYDLLDDVQKRLFVRLAVFVGGATIEDVESVCADGLGGDTLDALAALTDHSLVRQEQPDGEPRAFMLETIREYALERFVEQPDASAVRDRHAARYLVFAEQAQPHLMRLERKVHLARLEREHDNLRAAVEHCRSTNDAEKALRLVGALWRFWQMRGYLSEGRQYVEGALAMSAPASDAGGEQSLLRERALEAAGGIAYWQGDFEAMRRHYEQAVTIARASSDKRRIANALYNLSFTAWTGGDVGEEQERRIHEIIDEAIPLAREAGDRATVAGCLWQLGNSDYRLGNHAKAQPLFDEATTIFREIGDLFGLAWVLHNKGLVELRLNSLTAARRAMDETIALLAEARDVGGVALELADHAELALAEGDRRRSIRLAGASAAMRAACGAGLAKLVDILEKRSLEPTDEDRALWAEGMAMTFDEAVAYALRKT